MDLHIITDEGRELKDGFLIRLSGWTEERFFAEAPESRRWEYKDGEVIVPSPASLWHQDLVFFMAKLLGLYVEEYDLGRVFLGPAVLRLRPGLAKEPDIFFIGRERAGTTREQGVFGPADLVIEVLSPDTRHYDLAEKAQDYLDAGVLEYWAVDSRSREVRRHRSRKGAWGITLHKDGRLESAAVPGFWIDVTWLWEDPLPKVMNKFKEIVGS